ncbi:MAG: hypothetical protein JO257_13560 [Deltaproteobacteria bacterium]|nr:hypothetical protein [Deltaproteobacteria bacterium]
MGDLPVVLGAMDAVPPALRYRVREVLQLVEDGTLEGVARERMTRLLEDGEPWLGADPSLAEVGYWMLDARHAPELRVRGCTWLTRFPSEQTATRLAAVALDASTPPTVREQAIWALGYRQVRALHAATQWSPQAVQVADEALVKLADAATAAGKIASEQLPIALRHVQWEGAAAVIARAPGLWGEAIECFATPALARVLLVCLDDIPPQHRLRASRLVAAVLGEEALPMLIARAGGAALDEKLEMLMLIVTLAGEAKLPMLEDALKGMKFADLSRQRAKWHLQHKGVVPTVRGLRIARSTAVIAPAERAAKCAQAADDLGVLTRFARHPEAYMYTLWGWMVRGSGDPARARELVAAHPESQRLVRDLYLEDLARRGRVKQLTAAAQTLQGADLGALHLAVWGRPLAALELAATARLHTPELVSARALACFRAGRPDLTARILAEDLPPSEIVDEDSLPPFPGPHEKWLVEHAPDARPAITALVRNEVLALAKAAPYDAEPDTPSIGAVAPIVRRLGRGLPGSTVYLAGEFKYMDKGKIAAAVEAAGARLVNGPFPGTDYYVHGDWCLVQTIAQLERQGARRLRPGELEGV